MKEYADVAGTGFDGRAKVIRECCEAGEFVKLKREPRNKYDVNAIAIYLQCKSFFGLRVSNRKIGYIPAGQNTRMAKMMDEGVYLTAHVVSFWAPPDRDHPRVTIQVTDEYD